MGEELASHIRNIHDPVESFLRDSEVSKTSAEVQEAIKTGHVVARINEVNRKVEGKPYKKEYLQLVPTNALGCYALAGGVESTWGFDPKDKEKKAGTEDFQGPCLAKDFFYGNDLGVKSKESQRLAVLVEGPDKAKLAAAKQLAKAFNITEAEALAKIEQMGM